LGNDAQRWISEIQRWIFKTDVLFRNLAGQNLLMTLLATLPIIFALQTPQNPIFDGTGLSLGALVEQFKNEKVFWRQFEIAKEIVKRHDASVLASLEDWLRHEDRHIRGNVAFIFGRLGDARGLQVITDILADRSERPEAQGIGIAPGDGKYHLEAQIRTDRYYAAHLLGELGDPQAIAVLVPLLKDPETNSAVPWALGQIGDRRAVPPLLEALDDESPTTRVLAIDALVTLRAKEALPRLFPLLNDHRKSSFGAQVSVADAANAAIAHLQ
jgi:HEAT repeat protein